MFQANGGNFHTIILEKLPHIILTESARVISNVDFVRGSIVNQVKNC